MRTYTPPAFRSGRRDPISKLCLQDLTWSSWISCASCFSPTAIALGSSAIVKVSGQNCFRTLCGSLGQIRLGPPEGSAEGSTKVSPKFFKFPWAGPSPPGAPSFDRGSTKVSPRLRKFRYLSGLLGQICLGPPKGCVEGSLSLLQNVKLVSQFLNSFFAFFPNSISFGVFSHSKGLGAKWHVCLLGFFAANGFCLPKGSLEIFGVSCGFLGKWLLLQKRFCGGFRQLFFTFVSQMAVAS